MKFSLKDGILFGGLCIAFGIYSVVQRGGFMLSGEGWGDIVAMLVGVLVAGASIAASVIKKRKTAISRQKKK